MSTVEGNTDDPIQVDKSPGPRRLQLGHAQRAIRCLQHLLGHRRFPLWLALGGVLLMWPTLKSGLFADDLVQRPLQFKVSEFPENVRGLFPPDTGTLKGVLSGLFGRMVTPEQIAAAKDYGLLGWWAPDGVRFGLWRPLTAFTHWVDYRLFPDGPALMHAHSIAWFALAVFLAATLYQRLSPGSWIGGLAGLLFLLNKDTYFPVMFVANRGFFVALVFGLLALHEHHRWRSTHSRVAMTISACAFAASLFANEGGASSLAFILVYALVLERGSWARRALTVLPCAIVLFGWRLVYQGLGYGVVGMGAGIDNVGGYIDPSQEPLRFAGQLLPRMLALGGGQLTGIPCDALLPLNASWRAVLLLFYLVCLAVAGVVLVPTLRKSVHARFWCAVMVLALIPAATVTPLSKNLAFVAVGAFGVVAILIGGLVAGADRANSAWIRTLSNAICIWLLLAYIPGALLGRVIMVKFGPWLSIATSRLAEISDTPNLAEQDVILINPPLQIATVYAPCYRLYRRQIVPKSIRALVPGYTDLELQRTDEYTLVVQTRSPDLFTCGDLGPIRLVYAFNTLDGVVVGRRAWKPGDTQLLRGMTAEILAVSKQGLPSRVAFHFAQKLDSPGYQWLRFDRRGFGYVQFSLPRIGETVVAPGPVL